MQTARGRLEKSIPQRTARSSRPLPSRVARCLNQNEAPMRHAPVVVAIVNTNPDLVRLLRMNLERAGFVVFEMHIEDIKVGSADVSSFLEQHDPKVIVSVVRRPAAAVVAIVTALVITACDRPGGDGPPPPSTPPADTPAAASLGAHRPEALVAAATDVIGFLRGEVPFSRLRLADTVTLQLGREEGGTKRAVARERLREPSGWSVRSPSLGMTYRFPPPRSLTVLTTRVGRHLNCGEYALSVAAPALARLPHVGTMLKPQEFSSCLQTWNITIVFDADATPPTVVAAVYDQPEW